MKYKDNNFIGLFDSGFGGISILNLCLKLMPYESYVYFADSSHFPYGNKKNAELISIGENILSSFDKLNAKEVIIACNTMSTSDLPHFKKKFSNLQIIGTFPDFSQIFTKNLVLKEDKMTYNKDTGLVINKDRKKLLIIATTATCKSKYIKDIIKDFKNVIDIYVEPTDFIVKAVENDEVNTFHFKNKLQELFSEYNDIDYLVLGCTHFHFAEAAIREVLNKNVTILSSSNTSANNAYEYLLNNNQLVKSISPFITIIDSQINDEKIKLYNKLLKYNPNYHNLSFEKTF